MKSKSVFAAGLLETSVAFVVAGVALFTAVPGTPAQAQVFTDIQAALPGLGFGAAAWGDYDKDGRLDILLVDHGATRIYRNAGGNVFTNVNAGLPGMSYPCKTVWADYDRDGDLDFLLTGSESPSRFARNNGNGSFTVVSTIFPELWGGSMAWGDCDNDGDLDLVLTGQNQLDGLREISRLYRNEGNGLFLDVQAGFEPALYSSVAWGDYDNDGDLDLLLAGADGEDLTALFSVLYQNNGDGTFGRINLQPGVGEASVAWADYDGDGDLDMLLTGLSYVSWNKVPTSALCRNNGAGTFNDVGAGLPGVYDSSVAWGDYDNDGYLDLLLTGRTGNYPNYNPVAQVWRNTGAGTFTNINAGLPGISQGSAAWGDYDRDGDLDILLAGNGLTRVYRNNLNPVNPPLAVPTNLTATLANGRVVLAWSAGGASQPASVTYNVRLGTTPGGIQVVAPQSDTNGFRLLPAPGNAQFSRSFVLANLPANQTYYWSVQAVDSSFTGSPFAPEASFKLYAAVVPPSGPVPGDTNNDGVVSQAELDAVLAAYWPASPWLYITNAAGLGETNVTFALTNSIAGAYSVWMSTNLADWDYLGPASPRYEFTDTNAPAAPQRYYRLSYP